MRAECQKLKSYSGAVPRPGETLNAFVEEENNEIENGLERMKNKERDEVCNRTRADAARDRSCHNQQFPCCDSPLFSIVIPARDEEHHLPYCLEAIHRAAVQIDNSIEVIVVLNRCSDLTKMIAQEWNCQIASDDRKNLAAIRNTGCFRARGKILVTIDADSRMSHNMLKVIRATLEREDIIGGGVMMWPSRWSLGIFLTALCILPIALKHRISGGVFFCRRESFLAIKGFDESLYSLEDVDFAKRLRLYGLSRGKRFTTLFRASITTSMRKFDHFGDWYFLTHPKLFLQLLSGKDQKSADKVWYDFKRER
ncbi:MAG: glycosyltransferase [Bdellovibrionales bacterium]|nr:glycosyltransferase [Bdellovibrionales bacterium]